VDAAALFRLTRHDMDGDGAFHSFRAAGYLDMLVSDKQTRPTMVLRVPWWANLSFMTIRHWSFYYHLFFKLFGDTLLVARLARV